MSQPFPDKAEGFIPEYLPPWPTESELDRVWQVEQELDKDALGKFMTGYSAKDLSWLDSGRGGALVKPPATKLPPSALFRNRLALAKDEVKALRRKHREKGIGSTIQSAGRWLAEKWASLELQKEV